MPWHFWNQHKPDLCPDCIREALEGALKDLDEQVGANADKR